MQYKYVIVGGGIAAGRACEGIREVDAGGRIALAAGEMHRPYQRPPLSKAYLRGEADLSKVYLQSEDFYREQRVDLFEGLRVEKLERGNRRVTLSDGRTLEYEKLLLATGGRARHLSLPGADLKNVRTLRTVEDSDEIRAAAAGKGSALVLGGSFIGSEAAASLSQMGAKVTQAFPEEHLFSRIMPPEVSTPIEAMFEQHGVRLLPTVKARSLEGEGRVQRVRLDNGEIVDADLVVMGVGIDLNTELAQEAGLDLQEKDKAVLVNEQLRTSDAAIYAAGDIAAWPDPTFGERLRVEHWDVARQQGFQAGRNMAGKQEAYTVLPNFFSDLFDLSFDVWGNLQKWDQTVLRGSLATREFALFYFVGGRLTGALVTGLSKEDQQTVQELIRERPEYEYCARMLPDTNRPMQELLHESRAHAGR